MPPIPADTVVLFGAFLAAHGRASTWGVWLVTWLANVGSALLVYYLSRRYGRQFFDTRIGRLLLHPRQLDRVHRFYDRWGARAIFFSRFLPGFRAVVPLFAGVTRVGFVRTTIPLLSASALWYGFLVYLGHEAGMNWDALQSLFARYSGWLVWVTAVLACALAVWWVHTRRRHPRP